METLTNQQIDNYLKEQDLYRAMTITIENIQVLNTLIEETK